MKMIIVIIILIIVNSLEANVTKPKWLVGEYPKLVIFNLDKVLWPCWYENHVVPPFEINKKREVTDALGIVMKPYPGAMKVLEYFLSRKIPMYAISQSNHPKVVGNLVYLFKWHLYFKNKLIYPSGATHHFKKINETTGVNFEEMLYFNETLDKEEVLVVEELGVMVILVRHGVTVKYVEDALKRFGKRSLNFTSTPKEV